MDASVRAFVFEALYATITNTNFSPERVLDYVQRGLEMKRRLLDAIPAARRSKLPAAALWDETSPEALRAKSHTDGVLQTADPVSARDDHLRLSRGSLHMPRTPSF